MSKSQFPNPHAAPLHLMTDVPAALVQAWQRADGAQDDLGRARALLDLSNFHKGGMKWKSVEAAELALSYALRSDDRILTLKVLLSLSFVLGEANRVMEALQYVMQAQTLAESLGQSGRPYVLEAIQVRGIIRSNIGDEARARRDYLYVLRHPQDALDAIALLLTRINLGWLYVDVDQPEVALHHMGLAAEQWRELSQQYDRSRESRENADFLEFAVLETTTLATLAHAQELQLKGRIQAMHAALDEADRLLRLAWPIARQENWQAQMMLNSHESRLARMRGDLPSAVRFAGLAVELARRVGQTTYPRPYLALAEAHYALKQWPEAIQAYREAVGIARRSGGGHRMLQAILGDLAGIYEQQGDIRRALEVTREALRHAREVNRTIEEAQTVEDGVETPLEVATEGLAWQERLRMAEEEARLDPLTGLLNRRGLEAALLHLPLHASGTQPLLVAMFDIDQFKGVNDEFTHTVGDKVLQVVASLLMNALPAEALLSRYGGEEFVLALHTQDGQSAYALLEHCRKAVQDHDWSTLLPNRGLTISAGYALTSPKHFREAVHEADEALYAAKQSGRNRVHPPQNIKPA